MVKQDVGIGLIGIGVVGAQVAKVLRDKQSEFSEQIGCPIVLKRIKVLPQDLKRPAALDLPPELLTVDEEEFFHDAEIDIVVEATPGEHPGFEFQLRALKMGKHVVTSNKEVMAKHGTELLALAREQDVNLRFEASVGGGIPLISSFQHDLSANTILSIKAIINGTTNYILTRMAEDGLDFNTALIEAQSLGYAETNPTNDIEGTDAGYKLAILSTLAFHHTVTPQDIYREGISKLESRDFKYAAELGFAVKLLAIAKCDGSTIEARVHPVFVDSDSLLAKVGGVFNAILVDGDLVGQVMFIGQGAGALPTSSAVVADILTVAQDIHLGIGSRLRERKNFGKTIKPMNDILTRYYFRLTVADQPGVLAQIAHILGQNGISIASVIQKENDETRETAEIVIMSHRSKESAVRAALESMSTLPDIRAINNLIRVEEQ